MTMINKAKYISLAIIFFMAIAANLICENSSAHGKGYLPVYGGFSSIESDANAYYADGSVAFAAENGIAVGWVHKYVASQGFSLVPVRMNALGAAVELGSLGTTDLGETFSIPYAINKTGTVVGYSQKYDAMHNLIGPQAVKWNISDSSATELAGLGTDNNGATNSYATGINNLGMIVGYAEKYTDSHVGLGARAVRWEASDAAVTELGVLPGFRSFGAQAINDSGIVVGCGELNNMNGIRAIRWDATGKATEMGKIASIVNGEVLEYAPRHINNAGTTVGAVTKNRNYTCVGRDAIRWDATGMSATKLGNLGTNIDGETFCYTNKINDEGTTVGYARKFDAMHNDLGYRAVRWDAASTSAFELGNLGIDQNGNTSSIAYAINASGIIVGSVEKFDSSGLFQGSAAVYWDEDGNAVDINTLIDPADGFDLEMACDISNDGWILCAGVESGQSISQFFLIQIPEPSTIVLLIVGVLGIFILKRMLLQSLDLKVKR